jgi:8-oxo-dGTP pyrophosphatase MutT (NUDIX family)
VAALGLSGTDDQEPADVAGVRGGRQQLPVPANVRPGTAPPWARIPSEHRRGINLDVVRRAMAGRGPSQPVAGAALPVELPSPDTRPAAVLCALFDADGEAHVVLTRRSARLRSHTGEVSFPGGRLEGGEAPLAAALRETTEEIGLDPASVEILGQLSPLSTFANRSLITPFVGALPGRPTLQPNPSEVERAFAVSLAELVAEGVYRSELWEIPAWGWREMYMFELYGDTVWGATARMLRELLDLVFEGPG